MQQRIQKLQFTADIGFGSDEVGGGEVMPNSFAILFANGLKYREIEPYEDEDFDSLVGLWHTQPNGDEKVVGARMLDVWNKRDAEDYSEMIADATGWIKRESEVKIVNAIEYHVQLLLVKAGPLKSHVPALVNPIDEAKALDVSRGDIFYTSVFASMDAIKKQDEFPWIRS